MRETGHESSPEDGGLKPDDAVSEIDPYDYEEDASPFDWTVFLLRVAALVVIGATLVTSVDLSLGQDVEWQTVMRLSIIPFASGVLILAASELIDRLGE